MTMSDYNQVTTRGLVENSHLTVNWKEMTYTYSGYSELMADSEKDCEAVNSSRSYLPDE